MKSLSAQNALYEQEERNMKKKHKQLRELRKKGGNSNVFNNSDYSKSSNSTDCNVYDLYEYSEEWYVS